MKKPPIPPIPPNPFSNCDNIPIELIPSMEELVEVYRYHPFIPSVTTTQLLQMAASIPPTDWWSHRHLLAMMHVKNQQTQFVALKYKNQDFERIIEMQEKKIATLLARETIWKDFLLEFQSISIKFLKELQAWSKRQLALTNIFGKSKNSKKKQQMIVEQQQKIAEQRQKIAEQQQKLAEQQQKLAEQQRLISEQQLKQTEQQLKQTEQQLNATKTRDACTKKSVSYLKTLSDTMMKSSTSLEDTFKTWTDLLPATSWVVESLPEESRERFNNLLSNCLPALELPDDQLEKLSFNESVELSKKQIECILDALAEIWDDLSEEVQADFFRLID